MKNEMTVPQAEAIMIESHKGTNAKTTYPKLLQAAKTLMFDALENSETRMTDSELYAATRVNFNIGIGAAIAGLNQMEKAGDVVKVHEMVDGYKSTNFYYIGG